MRKKTIKIPIYGGTLTMILDDDLKYVEKQYKTTCLDDFGAVTLKNPKGYKEYAVAFTDKDHLSNIAHEIVHLKNYIFLDCGAQLEIHNDEPEAYLTGFLFDEIYNFLHSK